MNSGRIARVAIGLALLVLPAAAQVAGPGIFGGSGVFGSGVFSVPPAFFFYIDTTAGNDANTGKLGSPWLTTNGINSTGFSADTVTILTGQTIVYKTPTGWELYRALNMQANQTQLTVDVMTGACNAY